LAEKQQLAIGLDTGSRWTRCVICAIDGDAVRYLGHGQAAAGGWAKGRLADPAALAESIHDAVKQAEDQAGVQAEWVTAGVGGPSIHGANSRGVYEFGRPRTIDHDDLAYAVQLASKVRLEDDRLLLHVWPQDFTIDGRAGYQKPRNAVGSRLEANVHVITGSYQDHQCLVAAIHQAHLAVEETVYEPVAAAYACVSPEDRKKGVAVLDIGLHSADLVIYDGDSMLLATSLPVWADHLTRDVAWVLKVSYDDSECLKTEYGCAMLGLTADNSLIEVPSAEGRPSREARRRELNEILEARAEELFLYLKAELQRVGMEQHLLEGLVITGGGTLLNGMCDMAERVLNCQARNGLPEGIYKWPDELADPQWTTVAGLAMYSGRLKLGQKVKRRPGTGPRGLMGLVMR